MLAAQLRGHLVEGLAEMGEVAFGLPHRHLDVEVAGRDLVGGVDEPPDRRDEPVREIQAEPDRREQHDQRDQREHRGEGDLDARRFFCRAPGTRRPPRLARSAGTRSRADRPRGRRTGCARRGPSSFSTARNTLPSRGMRQSAIGLAAPRRRSSLHGGGRSFERRRLIRSRHGLVAARRSCTTGKPRKVAREVMNSSNQVAGRRRRPAALGRGRPP